MSRKRFFIRPTSDLGERKHDLKELDASGCPQMIRSMGRRSERLVDGQNTGRTSGDVFCTRGLHAVRFPCSEVKGGETRHPLFFHWRSRRRRRYLFLMPLRCDLIRPNQPPKRVRTDSSNKSLLISGVWLKPIQKTREAPLESDDMR